MPPEEKNENEKTEEKKISPLEQNLLDKEKEIFELKEKLEKGKKEREDFSVIVANPEVRTILDAIDKGEAVRVIVGDEEVSEKAYDPETVEELDNKGLIDAAARRTVELLGGVLDKRLLPMQTDLSTLKDDKAEDEKKNAKKEVDQVLKKYPDFSTLAEEVIGLKKSNPSLSIEELYVLARTRKGKGFPDPRSTESEKLTTTTPAPTKERKTPLPSGKKGFDQMLEEATESSDFDDIVRGAEKPSAGSE